MTKAKIYIIGTFDEAGDPIGWGFDCMGMVAAYDLSEDSTGKVVIRYGGYLPEELRVIAEARDLAESSGGSIGLPWE